MLVVVLAWVELDWRQFSGATSVYSRNRGVYQKEIVASKILQKCSYFRTRPGPEKWWECAHPLPFSSTPIRSTGDGIFLKKCQPILTTI